jgi:hypothetical protein
VSWLAILLIGVAPSARPSTASDPAASIVIADKGLLRLPELQSQALGSLVLVGG